MSEQLVLTPARGEVPQMRMVLWVADLVASLRKAEVYLGIRWQG